MTSCRDRAIEKRLAEAESRLDKLEKNGGVAPPPVTPATAAPTVTEVKPEGPLPVIEFDKTTFDFGPITEGQKVSHTYQVKNTGEAPLIIQNAQPSCGCTVPDWTKAPIPVGSTGYVKAEFDSRGKQGIQDKSITVTANTWPKVTTLRFKALVNPKPDGANGPLKN
ncbi:MAG: DUF1573 domain-containing protein [Bacteroidetes bacterium]|nr:DUF1573 domain-containing protein [Bacteroidota bacterium]